MRLNSRAKRLWSSQLRVEDQLGVAVPLLMSSDLEIMDGANGLRLKVAEVLSTLALGFLVDEQDPSNQNTAVSAAG